ncbi:hypothetical protein ABZT03_40655 [Streptomyces sp. NPDC005574]|uniref:hypothetical protein n=1 Tax=Streptomyces sp. NPDC005574 TaxID=3156891 RepID=UPI0033A623EC
MKSKIAVWAVARLGQAGRAGATGKARRLLYLPQDSFAWLTRYKTHRRHLAHGHLSRNECEHRHHAAELTLAT